MAFPQECEPGGSVPPHPLLQLLEPVRDHNVRGLIQLWTGIDDLSAEIFLGWTDWGLHVAARVRDDTFVQEKTGAGMWANDSFQIAFDPRNDAAGKDIDGQSGYGVDDKEFGIALTDLKDPESIPWILQRLFSCLDEPVDIDGEEVYASCCIGIGVYPTDGTDVKTMLRHASKIGN